MIDSNIKKENPALLVFSDDWGRHPSSCQHLVRRLLPKYDVYWVNTIGMRRPAFDRVTMSRGLGKMREWLSSGAKSSSNSVMDSFEGKCHAQPRVLSPLMWPWCGGRLGRRLNRTLLGRQLSSVVAGLNRPLVAITTIPIVADLPERLPVARWVYYCVDDFSKWPGLDHAAINAMEEKLVRRSDTLIAVSEKLQNHLARLGKSSHLLTHGVDLQLWQARPNTNQKSPFADLEGPIILFWGLIDWQMDPAFLRRLSNDLNRGTIVLLGPHTDPHPSLFSIPRVVRRPRVAYENLPVYAHAADVLVMPYADLPGLRESQPLKLKEYLATDKPAVVRDLPANRVWADALDVVATPEEFSATVRRRLETGLPTEQAAARERLCRESWDEKAKRFEQLAIAPLTTNQLQPNANAR